jgi:hypothetical protein
MHTTIAPLVLAALLIPAGHAAPTFNVDQESSSTTTVLNAYKYADVNVYDYTTVGTQWSPLIIETVEEFNSASPASAPQLTYVAASGEADCLDLSPDVWDLTGIIICDTNRPQDYPVNPNAPANGWAGKSRPRDDDTTVVVLNNVTPDGASVLEWAADNTVCHEMMHAYTFVDDAYGMDLSGSCVWGDLLSPGPTDIRLMRDAYPVTVEKPSWWDRTKATASEARERMCDAIPDVDISILWDRTRATGRGVRDRVSEVVPDVDIDIPGLDIGMPDVDIDMPDVDMPGCGE